MLGAQLEQQPHRKPLVVDALPEGHAAPQVHLSLTRGHQWRLRRVALRVPQPELKGILVPHAALQPWSEPPADGNERGVTAQSRLGWRLLSSRVEEDVELESVVWPFHSLAPLRAERVDRARRALSAAFLSTDRLFVCLGVGVGVGVQVGVG